MVFLLLPHGVQGYPTIVHRRDVHSVYHKKRQGVFADQNADLAKLVMKKVPELSTWENWYKPPALLKANGHLHTIYAALCRSARAVTYHREIIRTKDGGSLALDFYMSSETTTAAQQRRPVSWRRQCKERTIFADNPPNMLPDQPFLLLVSGLGGGLRIPMCALWPAQQQSGDGALQY